MATIVCARCKSVVTTEVSHGYYAYCPEHDEDLFEFETEVEVGK